MALEIPKEETKSITEISALSVSLLDKFVAALQSAPITADPDAMADLIANQIPSIPKARLSRFLDTIFTLYHIRELSGVDHDRFLADLVEGIEKVPQLQRAKKTDVAKLREFFTRLLGIENLNVVAKAHRLQRDGERLYCSAKIMSDIRPVFGADPAAQPLGAVLTHTLKIGYHEGRDHREVHIVLDSGDLDALGAVILRAQAKDKSLIELLKRTGLANLDE